MPLKVTRRASTGAITITGSVAGTRVRRRAQSNDPKLAAEEAAALEAEILRTAWHGERRGSRTFAEAALSYIEAAPRSPNHKARIHRLLKAMGNIPLTAANQEKALELKRKLLRPDAAPGTYTRAIIMPMRAILNYAQKLGWCDVPHFVVPREHKGRTRFLRPNEVERLIAAAAPHLRPLLTFLVGTGARMTEAVYLDWRDVDLTGARAIFWADRTKSGKRRNTYLPPRVVIALANLPHREGPVFRWHTRLRKDGTPRHMRAYADRERRYGGQIKTGWAGAVARSGLDPELIPHDLRHTWATWHYALHKDLIRLQQEGGWSTVTLVTRYAHLMPQGQEEAIRRFLWHATDTGTMGVYTNG
jgi:integrase